MALFAANVGAHPSPLVGALNILKHGRSALSLDLLFAATQLLRRPPFEIVHCHFGPAGLLAARLRRIGALTGKLVTTFYGCDVSEYLRAHGSEAYRLLIEEGDLFICITDAMRDRLIASGFPPDRIAKVPVGIHLSMFTPRSRRVRPREAIRLLTVARLVEKKGLETSIKAVAAVARSHPNLTYRIVGDGPLRGQLELLIASLRVEKWVELVGWRTQEQVRDEFDRSHIFVLASQTAPNGDEEGLPGVLKEAQAMGLPIVSTLHSGIPEGVLDGRSGFLVPERDVEAFADRLRYLIEHPERWPEMGRAGREFMEQHADIEKLNDLLVRTYEGLFAAAAA
ncbi:MAG: glycosyltransferase [Tepidisphaeraceae bacterium]